MKTRNQLRKEIESKQSEVNVLQDEIRDLKIQFLKTCDSEQTYEEKEEEFVVKKRPLTRAKHLVGRIHFTSFISDEDTGNKIPIKRQPIVMLDGKWDLNYYR